MLKFNVLTVSEEVGTNLGLKNGDKFINIPDFNCNTYIKYNKENQGYFYVPDFVISKILNNSMFSYYQGYGVEETIKNGYNAIKMGYADDIIVPKKAYLPYQGIDMSVIKYLDKEYAEKKRKEFLELWGNPEFYYIPYISLYKKSSLPYTFYEDGGLYKFNEKYEVYSIYGLRDPFNLQDLLGCNQIRYFNNIEDAKKELDIIKNICYDYYIRMINSDFDGLKIICEEVEKKYGIDSFYSKYVHFVFSELYLSDRYKDGNISFSFDITGIFRLYSIVKHSK